jgi:hypothetical protein
VVCGIAVLSAAFPRVLAYPLAVLAAWAGVALIHRGYRLYRRKPSTPGVPALGKETASKREAAPPERTRIERS